MFRAPLSAIGLTATILVFGLASGLAADTTEIVADRDNTLFESGDGELSSGAGRTLYAGRINFHEDGFVERRGILHFDLSSIPEGADVISASVRVQVTKVPPLPPTGLSFFLHRCLADWGEGSSSSFGGDGAPSTTNDATWLHGFYPGVTWSNPGGDFDAAPSGTTIMDGLGSYTFTGAGLAADVQSWIDGNDNHGWIMIGDVSEPRTVRQIASREYAIASQRPTLIVEWEVGGIPGDFNGDGLVDAVDLGLLLVGWSSGGETDLNGDGTTNAEDLGLLLVNWS